MGSCADGSYGPVEPGSGPASSTEVQVEDQYVTVDGFVHRGGEADTLDLRSEAWSLALDQRAFGPRRLVVAFGDADGSMRSLAHVERLDPPEDGLDACIRHLGLGSAVAVAFCDEPVEWGPPPEELAARFARAREIAASWNVHLVDWIACDDQLFRSCRFALDEDTAWWDLPDQ